MINAATLNRPRDLFVTQGLRRVFAAHLLRRPNQDHQIYICHHWTARRARVESRCRDQIHQRLWKQRPISLPQWLICRHNCNLSLRCLHSEMQQRILPQVENSRCAPNSALHWTNDVDSHPRSICDRMEGSRQVAQTDERVAAETIGNAKLALTDKLNVGSDAKGRYLAPKRIMRRWRW